MGQAVILSEGGRLINACSDTEAFIPRMASYFVQEKIGYSGGKEKTTNLTADSVIVCWSIGWIHDAL